MSFFSEHQANYKLQSRYGWSYQVADAVQGVERYWEGEADLGQPDEIGADGQRVDQVQVVGVGSR